MLYMERPPSASHAKRRPVALARSRSATPCSQPIVRSCSHATRCCLRARARARAFSGLPKDAGCTVSFTVSIMAQTRRS